MVSEKLVKEFQQIVKEDYNKDLSFEEASSIMNDMVNYYDLLAKVFHRPDEKVE